MCLLLTAYYAGPIVRIFDGVGLGRMHQRPSGIPLVNVPHQNLSFIATAAYRFVRIGGASAH